MFFRQTLLLSILAVAAAPPAFGAPDSKRTVSADPNRRICQEVGTIGTRLGKKKICATAAEWEEKKRQDRDEVDQRQRAARIGCTVAPSTSAVSVPAC